MSSPKSKARMITLERPLKNLSVTAGETATFECELSFEDIAVEWFLEGTKLEPSDRVSPNTPECSQCFLTHITARVQRWFWSEARPSVFPFPCAHIVQLSLSLSSYKGLLLVEVQDSS